MSLALYVLRSTFAEMLRPRKLLGWILVALVVGGIAFMYVSFGKSIPPAEAYAQLSAALVFRLLAVVAAVFATAVVAGEVEQRTIVYLLTRPIPRWMLYSMRLAGAILAVFVVSLLTAAMVSLVVNHGFPEAFWRDALALFIGSLAYTSFFGLISLLVNRAMIYCLLFAFGWETAVSNMMGNMYWVSISSYLSALCRRPPASEGSEDLMSILASNAGGQQIPFATAAWAMPAFAAVCILISAYWFSVSEFVAREDAE